MKFYNLLFLSLFLGVLRVDAAQETVEIINNTNGSVQITHPVSEYIKATISFSKIGQITKDEYLIIALPENFLSSDDGYSLNNIGQVAGFIRDNTIQQPKINAQTRWRSPLKMPSEKGHGYCAAVWSLSGGLIKSNLKNSRAVSLNDQGFVAVSQGSDLPHPDMLWDVKANDFENGINWTDKAIKVFVPNNAQFINEFRGKYPLPHSYILDINKNGASLAIVRNHFDSSGQTDFYFVNSGKYSVMPFQHELSINQKRLRTGLPIVNARLNDNDRVVGMVNVGGKQAIGNWGKKEGATVSGCLEDNPHFKGYTNFAIAGFNNSGQILLRADVGDINQLEHAPIKPRMYILIPTLTKNINSL